MNGVVLVLNQDYEPLNVTNLPRAFRLVFGAKAEILEYDHQVIRTVTREFHAPSVIRLQHRVRRPRPRVKLTRREVFVRDRHTCQYCGRVASDLTLDHILPRHRGAETCVTCRGRSDRASRIRRSVKSEIGPGRPSMGQNPTSLTSGEDAIGATEASHAHRKTKWSICPRSCAGSKYTPV